jgi:methylglutaconyl-CoA hydratase
MFVQMLKTHLDHSIARVTLDRPEIHNALNEELIRRLTETFKDLGTRSEVRAIVLQGNGKSFCAGADLNWTKRVATFTTEENRRDAHIAIEMFLTVVRCPKPVIARVHGAALGGGSGLVAASDICIATDSAQFGFTEVKLGIVPALISPFVIARIGAANAREYFLTGEKFSAATAKSIGLVNHVVQSEADMDALIEMKLTHILGSSPAAISSTKELILMVAGHPVESMSNITAEASVRSRASADAQAGVSAFLSHGKPPWVTP